MESIILDRMRLLDTYIKQYLLAVEMMREGNEHDRSLIIRKIEKYRPGMHSMEELSLMDQLLKVPPYQENLTDIIKIFNPNFRQEEEQKKKIFNQMVTHERFTYDEVYQQDHSLYVTKIVENTQPHQYPEVKMGLSSLWIGTYYKIYAEILNSKVYIYETCILNMLKALQTYVALEEDRQGNRSKKKEKTMLQSRIQEKSFLNISRSQIASERSVHNTSVILEHDTNSEVYQLRMQLQQLQQQHLQQVNQLRQKHYWEIQEHSARIKELQSTLTKVQNEKSQYYNQLVQQNNRLTQEVARLKFNAQDFHKQRQKLIEQREALRSRNFDIKTRLSHVERQNQYSEKAVLAVEENLRKLGELYRDKQSEEEQEFRQTTIEQLTIARNHIASLAGALEKKEYQIKQQKEQHDADLLRVKEQLAQSTANLRDQSHLTSTRSLHIQIETLQQQNRQLKQQKLSSMAQKESLQKLKTSLLDQKSSLQLQNKHLLAQNERLESEKRKLQEAQQIRTTSQQQPQQLIEQQERKTQELKQLALQLEKICNTLKQENKQLKNKQKDFKRQSSAQTRRLAQENKVLKFSAIAFEAALRTQEKQFFARAQQLEQAVRASEQRRSSSPFRISNISAIDESQTIELLEDDGTVMKLTEENNDLRQQISELKRKLDDCLQKLKISEKLSALAQQKTQTLTNQIKIRQRQLRLVRDEAICYRQYRINHETEIAKIKLSNNILTTSPILSHSQQQRLQLIQYIQQSTKSNIVRSELKYRYDPISLNFGYHLLQETYPFVLLFRLSGGVQVMGVFSSDLITDANSAQQSNPNVFIFGLGSPGCIFEKAPHITLKRSACYFDNTLTFGNSQFIIKNNTEHCMFKLHTSIMGTQYFQINDTRPLLGERNLEEGKVYFTEMELHRIYFDHK